MQKIDLDFILEATKGRLIGRFQDVSINAVCTDSREASSNSLFVPIVGEKVDAHKFLDMVAEAGTKIALSQREDVKSYEDMSIVLVDNTVKALQDIAALYRESITAPIVAITGSVGKTTNKEMIASALSSERKVYKTKANQNSQIGVPKTIIEADTQAEIIVIEMGISEFGEMSRISRVVKPDIAVVSNIGVAHIQNFGSREAIRDEKLHIIDFMKEHSKLYLNASDDMLFDIKLEKDMDIEYFSDTWHILSKNYASDVELIDACPSFTAHIGDKKLDISLTLAGIHQVSNAIVALSIADYFGLNLEHAAKSLADFKAFKHRQEIIKLDKYTVIDDSYNASPDSMKAALLILKDIKSSSRKIAVLADMKELGDDEVDLHIDIARFIEDRLCIDIVITLGSLAKYISDYLSSHTDISTHHFDDKLKMDAYIKNILQDGDVILLKGSNSIKLFETVDYIIDKE